MGLGETKKYSLQHTLKKNVKKINVDSNEMLKSGICLVIPNLFRTFAVSKW